MKHLYFHIFHLFFILIDVRLKSSITISVPYLYHALLHCTFIQDLLHTAEMHLQCLSSDKVLFLCCSGNRKQRKEKRTFKPSQKLFARKCHALRQSNTYFSSFLFPFPFIPIQQLAALFLFRRPTGSICLALWLQSIELTISCIHSGQEQQRHPHVKMTVESFLWLNQVSLD